MKASKRTWHVSLPPSFSGSYGSPKSKLLTLQSVSYWFWLRGSLVLMMPRFWVHGEELWPMAVTCNLVIWLAQHTQQHRWELHFEEIGRGRAIAVIEDQLYSRRCARHWTQVTPFNLSINMISKQDWERKNYLYRPLEALEVLHTNLSIDSQPVGLVCGWSPKA